jgi:hypothetical protein
MSKSEALAGDLESAYSEFADYAEGLSPEEWQAIAANHPEITAGEDEERSVGVVAHHLGDSLPLLVERAFMLASGEPIEAMGPGEVDAVNRRHAAANPAPDQVETLAMLRDNAQRAAALVRSLSDEQLERPGQGEMSRWTAERLIRRVVIGHVTWHEGSIKATAGR